MLLSTIYAQTMWQKEGCIRYEIFFVNFWVIFLCLIFVHQNLKKLLKTLKPKNLKTFSKTSRFFKPRARYVLLLMNIKNYGYTDT